MLEPVALAWRLGEPLLVSSLDDESEATPPEAADDCCWCSPLPLTARGLRSGFEPQKGSRKGAGPLPPPEGGVAATFSGSVLDSLCSAGLVGGALTRRGEYSDLLLADPNTGLPFHGSMSTPGKRSGSGPGGVAAGVLREARVRMVGGGRGEPLAEVAAAAARVEPAPAAALSFALELCMGLKPEMGGSWPWPCFMGPSFALCASRRFLRYLTTRQTQTAQRMQKSPTATTATDTVLASDRAGPGAGGLAAAAPPALEGASA